MTFYQWIADKEDLELPPGNTSALCLLLATTSDFELRLSKHRYVEALPTGRYVTPYTNI